MTELGNIELELYAQAAPRTVANFLQYVEAQYYVGGSFYRTVRDNNQVQNEVKIAVIQGGKPSEGANQKDSVVFVPIALESTKLTGLLHKGGVISMARGAPNSATTEFFICVNDQPSLDFGGKRNPDGLGFAAFGRVISGMDVVQQIHQAATEVVDPNNIQYSSGQMLLKPVIIKQISSKHLSLNTSH